MHGPKIKKLYCPTHYRNIIYIDYGAHNTPTTFSYWFLRFLLSSSSLLHLQSLLISTLFLHRKTFIVWPPIRKAGESRVWGSDLSARSEAHLLVIRHWISGISYFITFWALKYLFREVNTSVTSCVCWSQVF